MGQKESSLIINLKKNIVINKMRNNDQLLVDHLYNAIFVQNIRCDHFNTLIPQASNSIWNKFSDEKRILDNMVDNYKNYYKNKVKALKTELHNVKEANINSYLTYDADYYVSQYTQSIEEIDNYLANLERKTFDHISKEKLSNISDALNIQFPDYLVDPTLIGQL
jgi:hypothetical protein